MEMDHFYAVPQGAVVAGALLCTILR